ncbi:hypothetical protein [Pararhizobium gei]|uniref:hypothetical protein n=1 Tax=Pararhizobium gei TaxID=1395951 RepID=UPI0023D9BFCC|nr:hypothetical protein [Rhizobium gei]
MQKKLTTNLLEETRVSLVVDQVDQCVDQLRCVWMALGVDLDIIDRNNLASVRGVLNDAIHNIEEPRIWLVSLLREV